MPTPSPASRAAPLGPTLVDRLRAMLRSGAIPAGGRMNEVQLAASLGTSRTPVRGALNVLAGEGMLDYAARRGYRVRVAPAREVEDAWQARAVLEALAARQAAGQGGFPPALLAEAQAALAEGEAVLARGKRGRKAMAAYRAANLRFHEAVLAASGNHLLGRMLRLSQTPPPGEPPRPSLDELRRGLDDHHRIFQAITEHDAWRAETLMREHVLRVRDAAGE